MKIVWSSFLGLFPAATPTKLPVGSGQESVNALFRDGGVSPAPLPALRAVQPQNYVVPRGNGFEGFSSRVTFHEQPDRTLIFGDGFPQWFTATSNEKVRVGFATSGRKWEGAMAAASVAKKTSSSATDDPREYTFFVEYQNSQGDLSELQEGVAIALKQNDTATITVNKPEEEEKEQITRINVYASVAGDEPGLVFSAPYNEAVITRDFTAATDYSTSTRRRVRRLTSPDGRTTSIPADAKGMIRHPNGFYVVWHGNHLSFSEGLSTLFPFDWDLDIGFDIEAVIEYSNDLWCFGRDKPPVFVRVQSPEFPQVVESELSYTYQGGAAKSNSGVLYMSRAGLTHTKGVVLTGEKYNESTVPEISDAVTLGDIYLGLAADRLVMIDGRAKMAIGDLKFSDATHTQMFNRNGNAVFVAGGNVYEFDLAGRHPSRVMWKSKEVRIPIPVNFGGARVYVRCGTEEGVYFSQNGLGVNGWDVPLGDTGPERNGETEIVCEGELQLWIRQNNADKCIFKRGIKDKSETIISVRADYSATDFWIVFTGQIGLESVELAFSRKDLERS